MTDFPGETNSGATDQAAFLRSLNEQGKSSLVETMGIVITEASADRVVATMPVAGNTQLTGILHGGASCVLAETLGSVASWLHAGADSQVAGIEINATHHRVAASGTVTGVATALHRGRTLASYEVAITDEQDRRICTSRITCAIRKPG